LKQLYASYSSFCVQVDTLISRLEKLKSKAKIKFDEFDRNTKQNRANHLDKRKEFQIKALPHNVPV